MVVVGAHPQAEEHHRPIAYRLCERLGAAAAGQAGLDFVRPLVCTDLWWLNDPAMRDRPTISIGGPEVNALTAYLADKLPSAYAVDGVMMVQLDVEFGDPLAACWGRDAAQTEAAVDVFCGKYLLGFLQSLEA
jgi:hypothetical protein